MRFWTRPLLVSLLGASTVAAAAVPARLSPRPLDSDRPFLAATARSGERWINLKDSFAIADPSADPRRAQPSQSLALAAGDFDEDGVPDLVAAYGSAAGGELALYRGNIEARWPRPGLPAALPFWPADTVIPAPAAADLLAVGDMDADGHTDILLASRGGDRVHVLPGDGQGRFEQPRALAVPGGITTIVVGEIGRPDGLPDLALGIDSPSGAAVLVYASPRGVLAATPVTVALPDPPTAIAIGLFGEEPSLGLAVAGGRQLTLIGRLGQRALSKSAPASSVQPSGPKVDARTLDQRIVALAAGAFASDVRGRDAIALLGEDGSVALFVPDREIGAVAIRPLARLAGFDGRSRVSLVAGALDTRGVSTLMALDPGARRVFSVAVPRDEAAEPNGTALAFDLTGDPAAMLPMQLNGDGMTDLVFLGRDRRAPIVAPSSATIFVVNHDVDFDDWQPGDGICESEPASGKCGLRGAIREANAWPGADEIHFDLGTGTPTLKPESPLPWITEALTIDGGTGGATRVEISGGNAGTGSLGLVLRGGSSVLHSLVLNAWGWTAVQLWGDGNRVENCFIGTGPAGDGAGNGNGGGGSTSSEATRRSAGRWKRRGTSCRAMRSSAYRSTTRAATTPCRATASGSMCPVRRRYPTRSTAIPPGTFAIPRSTVRA